MGKILWNLLILWADLILLLNSSHAEKKHLKRSINEQTFHESDEISKQDAEDIVNIAYNLCSN